MIARTEIDKCYSTALNVATNVTLCIVLFKKGN